MTILKISVFDPALSGYEQFKPRLELLTSGDEGYTSEVTATNDWIIEKYGPFYGFTRDEEEDDRRDLLGRFNVSKVLPEPVFPVTVSEGGGMWLEYYMTVSRVRQLLRRYQKQQVQEHNFEEGAWKLIVDDTHAVEGDLEFMLEHTYHYCVRCFSRDGDRVEGEFQVKAQPHRLIWLCDRHNQEMNTDRARGRHQSLGIV